MSNNLNTCDIQPQVYDKIYNVTKSKYFDLEFKYRQQQLKLDAALKQIDSLKTQKELLNSQLQVSKFDPFHLVSNDAELQKKLAAQSLEMARLTSMNASLIKELETNFHKISELETLASVRLEKCNDADLERSRLADTLLSSKQASKEATEKIFNLQNELKIQKELISQFKAVDSPMAAIQICPKCQDNSEMKLLTINQAKNILEFKYEIEQLNSSLERELHANSVKSMQLNREKENASESQKIIADLKYKLNLMTSDKDIYMNQVKEYMFLNESHQRRLLEHAKYLKNYSDREMDVLRMTCNHVSHSALKINESFLEAAELVWALQIELQKSKLELEGINFSFHDFMKNYKMSVDKLSAEKIDIKNAISKISNFNAHYENIILLIDNFGKNCIEQKALELGTVLQDFEVANFTDVPILNLIKSIYNIQERLERLPEGLAKMYADSNAGTLTSTDLHIGGISDRISLYDSIKTGATNLLPIVNTVLFPANHIVRSQSLDNVKEGNQYSDFELAAFSPSTKILIQHICKQDIEIKTLHESISQYVSKIEQKDSAIVRSPEAELIYYNQEEQNNVTIEPPEAIHQNINETAIDKKNQNYEIIPQTSSKFTETDSIDKQEEINRHFLILSERYKHSEKKNSDLILENTALIKSIDKLKGSMNSKESFKTSLQSAKAHEIELEMQITNLEKMQVNLIFENSTLKQRVSELNEKLIFEIDNANNISSSLKEVRETLAQQTITEMEKVATKITLNEQLTQSKYEIDHLKSQISEKSAEIESFKLEAKSQNQKNKDRDAEFIVNKREKEELAHELNSMKDKLSEKIKAAEISQNSKAIEIKKYSLTIERLQKDKKELIGENNRLQEISKIKGTEMKFEDRSSTDSLVILPEFQELEDDLALSNQKNSYLQKEVQSLKLRNDLLSTENAKILNQLNSHKLSEELKQIEISGGLFSESDINIHTELEDLRKNISLIQTMKKSQLSVEVFDAGVLQIDDAIQQFRQLKEKLTFLKLNIDEKVQSTQKQQHLMNSSVNKLETGLNSAKHAEKDLIQIISDLNYSKQAVLVDLKRQLSSENQYLTAFNEACSMNQNLNIDIVHSSPLIYNIKPYSVENIEIPQLPINHSISTQTNEERDIPSNNSSNSEIYWGEISRLTETINRINQIKTELELKNKELVNDSGKLSQTHESIVSNIKKISLLLKNEKLMDSEINLDNLESLDAIYNYIQNIQSKNQEILQKNEALNKNLRSIKTAYEDAKSLFKISHDNTVTSYEVKIAESLEIFETKEEKYKKEISDLRESFEKDILSLSKQEEEFKTDISQLQKQISQLESAKKQILQDHKETVEELKVVYEQKLADSMILFQTKSQNELSYQGDVLKLQNDVNNRMHNIDEHENDLKTNVTELNQKIKMLEGAKDELQKMHLEATRDLKSAYEKHANNTSTLYESKANQLEKVHSTQLDMIRSEYEIEKEQISTREKSLSNDINELQTIIKTLKNAKSDLESSHKIAAQELKTTFEEKLESSVKIIEKQYNSRLEEKQSEIILLKSKITEETSKFHKMEESYRSKITELEKKYSKLDSSHHALKEISDIKLRDSNLMLEKTEAQLRLEHQNENKSLKNDIAKVNMELSSEQKKHKEEIQSFRNKIFALEAARDKEIQEKENNLRESVAYSDNIKNENESLQQLLNDLTQCKEEELEAVKIELNNSYKTKTDSLLQYIAQLESECRSLDSSIIKTYLNNIEEGRRKGLNESWMSNLEAENRYLTEINQSLELRNQLCQVSFDKKLKIPIKNIKSIWKSVDEFSKLLDSCRKLEGNVAANKSRIDTIVSVIKQTDPKNQLALSLLYQLRDSFSLNISVINIAEDFLKHQVEFGTSPDPNIILSKIPLNFSFAGNLDEIFELLPKEKVIVVKEKDYKSEAEIKKRMVKQNQHLLKLVSKSSKNSDQILQLPHSPTSSEMLAFDEQIIQNHLESIKQKEQEIRKIKNQKEHFEYQFNLTSCQILKMKDQMQETEENLKKCKEDLSYKELTISELNHQVLTQSIEIKSDKKQIESYISLDATRNLQLEAVTQRLNLLIPKYDLVKVEKQKTIIELDKANNRLEKLERNIKSEREAIERHTAEFLKLSKSIHESSSPSLDHYKNQEILLETLKDQISSLESKSLIPVVKNSIDLDIATIFKEMDSQLDEAVFEKILINNDSEKKNEIISELLRKLNLSLKKKRNYEERISKFYSSIIEKCRISIQERDYIIANLQNSLIEKDNILQVYKTSVAEIPNLFQEGINPDSNGKNFISVLEEYMDGIFATEGVSNQSIKAFEEYFKNISVNMPEISQNLMRIQNSATDKTEHYNSDLFNFNFRLMAEKDKNREISDYLANLLKLSLFAIHEVQIQEVDFSIIWNIFKSNVVNLQETLLAQLALDISLDENSILELRSQYNIKQIKIRDEEINNAPLLNSEINSKIIERFYSLDSVLNFYESELARSAYIVEIPTDDQKDSTTNFSKDDEELESIKVLSKRILEDTKQSIFPTENELGALELEKETFSNIDSFIQFQQESKVELTNTLSKTSQSLDFNANGSEELLAKAINNAELKYDEINSKNLLTSVWKGKKNETANEELVMNELEIEKELEKMNAITKNSMNETMNIVNSMKENQMRHPNRTAKNLSANSKSDFVYN